MTFLDTVDGKLARTTMTYSSWGNVYDHGIDLIHPPFWYWAWFIGLGGTYSLADPLWIALLAVWVGYVVDRAKPEYIYHDGRHNTHRHMDQRRILGLLDYCDLDVGLYCSEFCDAHRGVLCQTPHRQLDGCLGLCSESPFLISMRQ